MNNFQKASAVHRGFAARLKELVSENHEKRAMAGAARMMGRMGPQIGQQAAGFGNRMFGSIGRAVGGMQPGAMKNMLTGIPQGSRSMLTAPGVDSAAQLGKTVSKRVGAVGGGAYLLDQNGQRRGQNNMAEHYNDMGYFPKLMMALMNRQAPTQSMFNPSWMLPYS